jgi:ABC-type iron transport system FetAB permease component
MQIASSISYIFLFLSLCIFVYLTIILINLFTKSYRPQYVIPFIVVIVGLYLFNTSIAYNSIKKSVQRLTSGIDQRLEEQPKIQKGTKQF